MQTHERHRKSPARQLDAFRYFRNDSDLCVFVAVPRHQEDVFVAAGVQCQRYGHSRENHRVIQRNERKSCHRTNHMHIVDVVNY